MDFTQQADHSISLVRKSFHEIPSIGKKEDRSLQTKNADIYGTSTSFREDIKGERQNIFCKITNEIELTEIQTGCHVKIYNFKVLHLKSAFDFIPDLLPKKPKEPEEEKENDKKNKYREAKIGDYELAFK